MQGVNYGFSSLEEVLWFGEEERESTDRGTRVQAAKSAHARQI